MKPAETPWARATPDRVRWATTQERRTPEPTWEPVATWEPEEPGLWATAAMAPTTRPTGRECWVARHPAATGPAAPRTEAPPPPATPRTPAREFSALTQCPDPGMSA